MKILVFAALCAVSIPFAAFAADQFRVVNISDKPATPSELRKLASVKEECDRKAPKKRKNDRRGLRFYKCYVMRSQDKGLLAFVPII